jgi:hypothetical protein
MSFTSVNGKDKIKLGTRKSDNRVIYISRPKWDCGWYWGFGYIGNRDEHYHLSSYANARNINMYDALLEDYDLNPKIKKHLWDFCELVKTAYVLKETAEVLGRGGSHYTKNVCASVIKNSDEVTRINEVVLPAIFEQLNLIYEGNF